ncbi:hypothetical protein JT359_08955 [Candidatus Poribacteria bacterium]|nr:hypothetical protein [Candidatus Poribacteria bacterium]
MKFLITTLTILYLIFNISIYAQLNDSDKKVENPTLSGTIVDINDNPIEDVSIAIMPMKLIDGHFQPLGDGFQVPHFHIGRIPLENLPNKNNNDEVKVNYPVIIKSDQDGKFTTNSVPKGFVQLSITPYKQNTHITDKKIQTIQIGKITFYENDDSFGPDEKFTFKLDTNEVFENIKIKVKKLLKIKAQVVSKDKNPIKNTRIRLNMILKSKNGSGSYGTSVITDDSGYFTYFRSDTGIYTVSVEYQNFKGGLTPFQLDYETPAPENLVIKLDGNPIDNDLEKLLKSQQGNGIEHQAPPNIDPSALQELIQQQRKERNIKQKKEKRQKEVWIINPGNGHAYKKIQCDNWHDAQQTAIDEFAHLVSINDVNEQLWIQTIFGRHPYWIGLTDLEEEGVWKWDSGEPVNYTNWNHREIFGSSHTDEQKDYVAMTFHYGGWQSVASEDEGGHSPLWNMTRHAIIEKDGLISKKLNPDGSDEE